MFEGYLRVLAAIRNSADLSLSDIEVVDRQIAVETASLDLFRGKEALRKGDVEAAIQHLETANAFFHQRKITASLLLLRFAPRLFLSSYRLVGH